MYENLVERLRRTYTVCGWDDLKIAADAIETIGICWADSKRYAGKLEHENLMLRIELDRLKRERDQAVEELHRNTDAVPVVRCKDCKHSFERSERKPFGCYLHGKNGITLHDGDDFCSYGERKESNE